jgi:hypothetical protein
MGLLLSSQKTLKCSSNDMCKIEDVNLFDEMGVNICVYHQS